MQRGAKEGTSSVQLGCFEIAGPIGKGDLLHTYRPAVSMHGHTMVPRLLWEHS